LVEADLEANIFGLGDELVTLFWTDFRDGRWHDSRRVELVLSDPGQKVGDVGTSTRIATLSRGEQAAGVVWSRDLGNWCREQGARPEDDLIVRVLDPEKQRYAVELQPRGTEALDLKIAERNRALVETAHQIARAGRPFVLYWQIFPRLIAHDVYADPLPPDSWPQVLRADLRFVVDRYEVNLCGRLVDEMEREQSAPADVFAYPRPRINRNRGRSEDVRQAWGRYLFDQGMEWRWA
jgi:hypothetical protein